jgi:lysophospholipase L1-like esterase
MPRFEQGDVIVFEGDSLTNRRSGPSLDTWPFLHLMNWQGTWADELMKMLFCWRPELDLTFHNAAVGGSNIKGVTERFEKFVLPHKPDWVLMTIGNNDPHQGIEPDEFKTLIDAYVERVKKECGGCICFLGGPRPEEHNPPDKIAQQETRMKYHDILRETADDTYVFYIDYGTGLSKKAKELYDLHEIHTVYSDGGHLNQVGSIIVAGEILKVFEVAADI